MSFWKCCVGADSRPPPESIRPVSANNRRNAQHSSTGFPSDATATKKKMKMPTEVFFDPSKPDGQLSSITDPPTSHRDASEAKKRKDGRDKNLLRDGRKTTNDNRADLDAPDNNGLTRGQNFMKVEKWLRNACMHKQIDITPGEITNIEDGVPDMLENTADPPSEKDKLPPAIPSRSSRASRASSNRST